MDVVDPSRPELPLAATNATSASASRLAVVAAPNATFSSAPSLASVAPPKVSQFSEERPHWDRMRQQLLRLPANTPHCLPYIVDEAVSISPEEAQSAIQGRGMCTNTYYRPQNVFINRPLACSMFLAQSIVVSRAVQRILWTPCAIRQDLSPDSHHHRAHQCW
jgi:hypothetical protein